MILSHLDRLHFEYLYLCYLNLAGVDRMCSLVDMLIALEHHTDMKLTDSYVVLLPLYQLPLLSFVLSLTQELVTSKSGKFDHTQARKLHK